jgi:hypothetical protein
MLNRNGFCDCINPFLAFEKYDPPRRIEMPNAS